MMQRRTKLEIQLEVLNAVKDGVEKPTRIMYAVNMAWNPVNKILDRLVHQGLLLVKSNTDGKKTKRRYAITEKGISVLHYLEGAKELINII